MKLLFVVVLLSLFDESLILGQLWDKSSEEEYEKLKETVAEGARAGLRECERQFQLNKWNCTVSFRSNQLPIFVRSSLPFGEYGWRTEIESGTTWAEAVKASLKRRCRCHGVTGSCQTQTCSQRIGEMNEIGDYLKKRYRYAKVARYSQGKLQFKTKKGFRFVGTRNYPLLFLVPSPDYCVKNMAVGSSGVFGRMCPQNQTLSAQCGNLCRSCRLWPRPIVQEQTFNCYCKFHWCCMVRCSKCKRKVTRIACLK